MRKERDRAVSELAESLRESDAVKKQRNELVKETKVLREALETHLERESSRTLPNYDHVLDHTNRGHTELVELELTSADEEGLEFGSGRDFSGKHIRINNNYLFFIYTSVVNFKFSLQAYTKAKYCF